MLLLHCHAYLFHAGNVIPLDHGNRQVTLLLEQAALMGLRILLTLLLYEHHKNQCQRPYLRPLLYLATLLQGD